MIINVFGDEYEFLSNFYYSPFTYKGIEYKTNEHFYQSKKATNDTNRDLIINAARPGEAKNLSRQIEIVPDWEQVKLLVMYIGLQRKFKLPELKEKLLSTGNDILVEGNYHHDNIWGDCFCEKLYCSTFSGKNWLGYLLMEVREELK